MKPLEAYIQQAQQLENIILKAGKVTDQLIHGNKESLFKGRGMLFEDIRKYQPGDDVRAINWSVTARLREAYVKTYNEEKGQTIWLVLDASRSGNFGTRTRTKLETLAELSAVLALIGLKKNYRIGAVIFTDKVISVHPPSITFAGCMSVLHSFIHASVEHTQTDLRPALDYLISVRHSGALIFVLSDFISVGYQTKLKVLAQKHDLVGIRVYDKSEVDFPSIAYVNFLDAESQLRTLVNTSSASFRTSYKSWMIEHSHNYQDAFLKLNQRAVSIATDEDYTEKLKKTLLAR